MDKVPLDYIRSDEDNKMLEVRFNYHSPKDDQPKRYQELRDKGKELASLMLDNCPRSRELSLAITNLEQALFWANASIARNE